MKIAQVAPLYESVPPKLYGGTERVVSYLTDTLVELGHEVTLYASGDSQTLAKLVPVCDSALRLNPDCIDGLAYHMLAIEWVFKNARQFDLIHFHTDYLHFPLSRRAAISTLTTLHGRLDLPELRPLYQEFQEMPLVSVSLNQRGPLPWVNWVGTVYHGLPTRLLAPNFYPGTYLAFLGRISPEKRVDFAIEVALQADMPLKIAAKVDAVDRAYFKSEIEPLLDHPLIQYIGEIGEREKGAFLGGAVALLFPVDWPEPFGLAMIEAMACGTPVIARKRGSIPEIIEPGKTGFICETVADMVAKVKIAHTLDRQCIRSVFESRFSAKRMTSDYIHLYEDRLNSGKAA